MPNKTYDVVVIGSGPAGYTAALYAARASLDVLVFQGFEVDGQLMLTSDVENYPGYRDGVLGPDMMDDFEAQAARFGAKMRPENVERVDFSERPFKQWAEGSGAGGEEPVLARSVIIATGAKAKWIGLPSEQRLMGRGVSGCATCDGFFFKDKRVAVVGGGDTAMEEATFLTKFAAEVLLIHHRDQFRASKIMLDRAQQPQDHLPHRHGSGGYPGRGGRRGDKDPERQDRRGARDRGGGLLRGDRPRPGNRPSKARSRSTRVATSSRRSTP